MPKLAPYRKAVVAFVALAATAFAAKHGFNLDEVKLRDILESLPLALVGTGGVYQVPNAPLP